LRITIFDEGPRPRPRKWTFEFKGQMFYRGTSLIRSRTPLSTRPMAPMPGERLQYQTNSSNVCRVFRPNAGGRGGSGRSRSRGARTRGVQVSALSPPCLPPVSALSPPCLRPVSALSPPCLRPVSALSLPYLRHSGGVAAEELEREVFRQAPFYTLHPTHFTLHPNPAPYSPTNPNPSTTQVSIKRRPSPQMSNSTFLSLLTSQDSRDKSLNPRRESRRATSAAGHLPSTLLISFRKSTTPQNCRLSVYHYFLEY
jgi:hypothetical protein